MRLTGRGTLAPPIQTKVPDGGTSITLFGLALLRLRGSKTLLRRK